MATQLEQLKTFESEAHRQGMRDAAQILAIYPADADGRVRWILDQKRKEILAAAGCEETKPSNPRRLGDGVTAQMAGAELQLSVRNGNANDNAISECVIVMGKETCEGLSRYMGQHVFCGEPEKEDFDRNPPPQPPHMEP